MNFTITFRPSLTGDERRRRDLTKEDPGIRAGITLNVDISEEMMRQCFEDANWPSCEHEEVMAMMLNEVHGSVEVTP